MNKTALKAMSHALAFVLGFSAVFIIAFGLPAAAISKFIAKYPEAFGYVGGVIVIILGLHILLSAWNLSPFRFLLVEKKMHYQSKGGYWSTVLIGIAFAAGWTPCIGPILAAILAVAMNKPGAAIPMMVFYSLGLAIPFLLVALLIGTAIGFVRKLTRYIPVINFVSSLLLIAVGFALFFGYIAGKPSSDPKPILMAALYIAVSALLLLLVALAIRSTAKGLQKGLNVAAIVFTTIGGTAIIFWGVVQLAIMLGGTTLNAESSLEGAAATLGIAFLGGLASFLSPCVLPMVPTYILIITGLSFEEVQAMKKT
jgi:cytochrome c-type biogenesis protein